jgi:hypothetical protein
VTAAPRASGSPNQGAASPPFSRWRAVRADLVGLVALIALGLAAYAQLLDPGRMLADYDAYVYFYPLRAYAAAAIQAGRLPLWNPSSFLGVPFLANPQTALFYPGTWLFFWLPVPLAYGLNLFLHVGLAGLFFYAFVRVSLSTKPAAAFVGAAAFMLGGVLAGQYGHLNQISAVAWVPLVLLAGERAVICRSRRWAVATGALVAVQLLAGHPQQSYMTLLALAVVTLGRALREPRPLPAALRALGLTTLAALLGAGLAGLQLLPTAELAAASVRGAGLLSYRDAIAGSLWPWLVARALLPGYVNDLGSTEYLAYVGLAPLALALLALGVGPWRRLAPSLTLVGLGLFLALGGANPLYPALYAAVPGVASFRVPARWLLLYSLGICSLASLGLEWVLRNRGWRFERPAAVRLLVTVSLVALLVLATYFGGVRATRALQAAWLVGLGASTLLIVGCALPRWRRPALIGLLLVVALDLWLAGADLAPRTPPPAEAYAQPRDSTMFMQARLGSDRFLSVASEEYELKEAPDYREWLADLPEPALTALLVAAKRNEILTPNVNLLYQLDDLDGYDGGLLPPARYLDLASLLVPREQLRPDGALISRLESLPSRRLMDLFNLRLVLTDRARDIEVDGVEYDRAVLVTLRPGERLKVERVPGRAYTTLGLIGALVGASPPDGATSAHLELSDAQGGMHSVALRAGHELGLAVRPAASSIPAGLTEVQPIGWSADGDPVEYLGMIPLPDVALAQLAVVNEGPSDLQVRALTLLDERDTAVTSLVLDDHLERTRFFDMKVYEYPGVLPRAYLLRRAVAADDAAALALLASPDFDPRREAVVEPGAELALNGPAREFEPVERREWQPERQRLRTRSEAPSLLVVAEAFYPGWSAYVDGQPARLLRVDVGLRGVALPAGLHEVELIYAPASWRLGIALSACSLAFAGFLFWRGFAGNGARRSQ